MCYDYRGYSADVFQELVEKAKTYDKENYELFVCEIGWDSSWMPDFVENIEAEFLNDYERRAINSVLISAFEEAHNFRFSWREREYWMQF